MRVAFGFALSGFLLLLAMWVTVPSFLLRGDPWVNALLLLIATVVLGVATIITAGLALGRRR